MLRFRKLFSLLAVALFVTTLLSCGAHDSDEYYVFVSANLRYLTGKRLARVLPRRQELKVRADFVGPNNYDPKAERERSIRPYRSRQPAFCWA